MSSFADRFVLEGEAGVGGMGIVYRAFDRVSHRTVALKVLRKIDRHGVRRFAAEAEALVNLDHPAIVRYLAHGTSDDGEPYLAMEWIEGESLSARLARLTVPDDQLELLDVLELGQRLADALAAAHAMGIVHRDVKPGNILLAEGRLDRPTLADFGVVRTDFATHVTTSGMVIGTVGYMAPEQAYGDAELDGRADLFALGCVLFRCLTNTEAFEGTATMLVLSKVLLHEPPHVGALRPDVPLALDALVVRLLAKDREQRPSTAAEVQRELAQIAADLRDPRQISPRYVAPSSTETSALDHRAKVVARWWRSANALRVAIVAFAVLAVVLSILLRPSRRGSAVQPPPSQVSELRVPVPITSLAASPTCGPVAVEKYQQGLQALREAGWIRALHLFEEAAEADPSCPEVRFRLVITGEERYPLAREREQLQGARAIRDQLSERDRILLDAWTAVIAPDVPHEVDAVRILEDAEKRFPEDAEIHTLTALRNLHLAPNRVELEAALDRARRASFIDPAYADAWSLQALILGYLGRDEDALAALDRCIEISPGALDCIDERIQVLRRRGQCGEAVAETRRHIAWEPNDTRAYYQLAISLASSGASREAIDEALRMRWSLLSPEKREWMTISERAKFAVWMGDFDRVLEASSELTRLADRMANVDAQLRRAVVAVDAFLEVDRGRDAALAAERFLRGEAVWVRGDANVIGLTYYVPQFLAAELETGKLSPAAWREATGAWEQTNRARTNDFERWILRWGPAVGSRIGAAEAAEHMPPLEARRTVRSSPGLALLTGVMDAYEGRLLLQADDPRGAAPLLQRSARSCNSLDFPFLNVRTHLWLGMAKEKLGDTEAACEAYRFVIERWGGSKLTSVTARAAKERSRALGCKPAELSLSRY